MGRIPNKSSTFRDKAHPNFMGGPSYDIEDPLLCLRIAATSCFFGEPMYYHRDKEDKRKPQSRAFPSSRVRSLSDTEVQYLADTLNSILPAAWRTLSPAELLEKAIDAALDKNPEATLQFAVELRNQENIRTTPQVILVRAAHHHKVRGTTLIRQYAKDIIKRADEPSVCLAYNAWRYDRRSIPNSLKKSIANALSGFSEYQLAKYKMENSSFKTRDVVNLVHPKSTSALNKLIKGELTTTGETWEAILSADGASKESWLQAIPKMGHMALLRNIRNFLKHSVDPKEFVDKLIDTAEKGKQLPFRYYSAYNANDGAPARVLDAIETCLEKSLGNLPAFSGRLISLCDNSGSAHGSFTSAYGSVKVSDIANLTGVITAKRADDGYLGVFGDRLETFSVRKKSSVFDDHKHAQDLGSKIGGGTENGIWLFWDKAIKNKEHWDHIFVYSDMQAGHGGLYGTNPKNYASFSWGGRYIDVPKLVAEYREKVNPHVLVYLVQVAGYQDTIMPEFYDRTFILGGWSDSVIRFAAKMSEQYRQPTAIQ